MMLPDRDLENGVIGAAGTRFTARGTTGPTGGTAARTQPPGKCFTVRGGGWYLQTDDTDPEEPAWRGGIGRRFPEDMRGRGSLKGSPQRRRLGACVLITR